jgi:hypothetical protein
VVGRYFGWKKKKQTEKINNAGEKIRNNAVGICFMLKPKE